MAKRSLLIVLLLLLACQLPQAAAPPTPTSPPSTAPAPQATPQQTVPPFQTAEPPEVITLPEVEPWPDWSSISPQPPQIENQIRFTPSLDALVNPAALPALDDDQRRLLIEQEMLILSDQADEPAVLLNRQLEAGQPYWIGADQVIWRMQTIHTQALRTVEDDRVVPLLGQLLTTLAQTTAAQYSTAISDDDPLTAAAAQRNLAYLTITAYQLDAGFPIDPLVRDLVQSELDLMALAGEFQSPYSGRTVNYGAWQTQESALKRAQRWLTTVPLVDFAAVDPRLQGRQLQLLFEALDQDGETADRWRNLYQLHNYLEMGDDQTLQFWRRLQKAPTTDVDSFVLTIEQFNAPPFYLLPVPQDWRQAVFNQLIFNQVGLYTGPQTLEPYTRLETTVGEVRLRPRPLDLALVSGDVLAARLLAESGDAAYERFAAQAAAAQTQLVALPYDFAGWPRVGLSPILNQENEATARQLEIWRLAVVNQPDGWVQIAPPDEVILYLEPEPELYAHLAAVTAHLGQTLILYEMIDGPTAAALDQLSVELRYLAQLAGRELSGYALVEEDRAQLARWVGAPPAGSLPRPIRFFDGEPAGIINVQAAVPLLMMAPIDGQQVIVSGWTFLARLE